ncbi:hypothetical protein niasHT_008408 [Heterodera trifolii]|uniref:Uncharacterized protein n=1 Tax=Heterodera trifolii TaxID=157864 RepID=A0ABD2LNW1_9BILA
MQKAINAQPPHHGFPSPPTAAGRSYSVPIYALPSGKHKQQAQDDDDDNDKEQQRGRPPHQPCPLPGFCRDWHGRLVISSRWICQCRFPIQQRGFPGPLPTVPVPLLPKGPRVRCQ